MKKQMVWCLTLALCLLLSACDGSGDGPRQASLPKDTLQMEETEILLAVDGREVPAWRYLYWLRRACAAIRTEYEAAGMEPDWDAVAGSGTLAEYAKQQALEDTVLYATVENWAEQYGVSVEETEPVPAEAGLTQEQTAELARTGRLYAQLYQLFCSEGSALAPAEEELAAFAKTQGWVTYDRIFVAAGEDRGAAAAKAAELFARLNGAADSGTEFTALVAESGGAAEPQTIRLGEGVLTSVEEDALAALEAGQYTGILETADGFCILRRLTTPVEMVQELYFDRQLQRAAEAASVQCTQAYETLDAAAVDRQLQSK